MLYQTFAPPPLLEPFVRFFWVLEADADDNNEFVHRSIADCCVEMVFHYREAFDEITPQGMIECSPLANIQAQSTQYRRYVTRRSFGIFGVYMYPFAIPRFFSIAASDLTNISPDLRSVLGYEGTLLDERVAEARSTQERISIVSDFLLSKLHAEKRDLPYMHGAIHSVMGSNGSVRIETLAKEYGMSKRHFERKFKEIAGLSPKLYSRVARFQAATHFKFHGCRDLAEIAYSCGYYDQSHFTNEFREFSGYTPSEYFWNIAEGTQYINPEKMSHFSNTASGQQD